VHAAAAAAAARAPLARALALAAVVVARVASGNDVLLLLGLGMPSNAIETPTWIKRRPTNFWLCSGVSVRDSYMAKQ
jgi:hypothetical protein